ncbi:MAG: nucleotidyl transferase AbiEii/AbiGii toxin family protein [Spirochaetota bacterium]
MINTYYDQLYKLQDQVLEIVFAEPLGFYLTGGTALSRFYFQHRYSDDLDFFHSDVAVFPDAFRIGMNLLKNRWPDIHIEVDGRDFKRLRIKVDDINLKLDFVADRVPRIGLPQKLGKLRIDTVRNILSNKICAILGRDEAKDMADFLWISKNRRFYWPEIITEAQQKEIFTQEDLIYRLRAFPVTMLEHVTFQQEISYTELQKELQQIIKDIEQQDYNHLADQDKSQSLE